MQKQGRNGGQIRVYYTYYTTSLQCIEGSSLPAELRFYCPSPNETILPDDTVAFVIAAASTNASAEVTLESFYVSAVPGNPSDDAYEENIPNVPIPFVFGLGQVIRVNQGSLGDNWKSFTVSVGDYVRGKRTMSMIE